MFSEKKGNAKIPFSYYIGYGIFYMMQGYSMTFLPFFMPGYMTRVLGLSVVDAATIMSIVFIPWAIKILPGIVSDAVPWGRFGRRRPYIALMSIVAAFSAFGLMLITQYSTLFVVLLFCFYLGVAFTDAVTDALALDAVPRERYGFMLGIGWGCRAAGACLAGIFGALLLEVYGWSAAFLSAGIPCLLMTASLAMKEPKMTTEKRITKALLKEIFTSKHFYIGLVFFPLSWIAMGGLMFFEPFCIEIAKFSETQAGSLIALNYLGMFIGAPLGGRIADKIGHKRGYFIFTFLWASSIASFTLIGFGGYVIALVILCVYGFFDGMFSSAQMAVAGDLIPLH